MIAHKSVLTNEIINFLDPKNGTYLDLTFGFGGHSRSILEYGNAKVIAFDKDLDVINSTNFSEFKERFKLIHSDFKDVKDKMNEKVNGILLDLGVSTHQLKSPERGFSFNEDGPLDMRMNQNDPLKAQDIINNYSKDELIHIFMTFGEERFAYIIAKNIVDERALNPITTTKALENIIFHSYPKKLRYQKIHPATKVFQALRIAVNDELTSLETSIIPLANLLLPKGKMAIISFHSLEDRIVKRKFLELKNDFKILTKRPITPSLNELTENKRSRSAKLRVIEKN